MGELINISSDDKTGSETTDNFTSPIPNLICRGNWEIALESMDIWYSWYNISADYNNQTFRYYNGAAWANITITPGVYSLEAINTFVQAAILANGDTPANLVLSPNYNTGKTALTLAGGYQVDFTVGTINELLGFAAAIVTTSQEGTNIVDITNGVDRVYVHCDWVTGSVAGGIASDVIYSFSVNSRPSSRAQINPNHLLFLPMKVSGALNRILIRLTDQRGRRLNLNGDRVALQLFARPIGGQR